MGVQKKIEIMRLSGIFWECLTCEIEKEYYLHIYYTFSETEGLGQNESFSEVIEESRRHNINSMYSCRLDQCNYMKFDPDKIHLHVYKKGNEIFAINRDGTAHDGYHGIRIPDVVAAYVRTKFPDFSLPTNNFIESIDKYYSEESGEINYLMEGKN